MQVNYDRPSSQRPTIVANDSPVCFPTAASANAVAFRHAAAEWTTATRARPGVGRSLYLALAIHSGSGTRRNPRAQTPEPARCYLSRMPRDIDVVGVWHGTPYQVASLSSTANGVIVACGPTGRHTTYPKTGHRHIKAPSSGTSTWYERQVLSDVTLAQPLHVIAFSAAKPPVWAKPYATRPSHDSFTFQVQTDGQVRLALVGVREADDAVIVVTKQAAAAPRLFRRYAPNVLMWTVPSDKA